MEQALPILAGILCGLLAAAPYAAALAIAKKRRDASVLPAVVAVCVSMVVIALSMLLSWFLFRDSLLAFVVALVIVFLVAVVAGVVVYGRKRRI